MSNSLCQMMLSCLVITLALLALTSQAQLHSSGARAGVSFAPQNGVSVPPKKVHSHRMYGMCPPQFQRVGTDCYSLVQQPSNWLEAHFFCKDKNANLAEPSKKADRKLRTYLQRQDSQSGEHDPIWIGATYDHHNNYWQWSVSGRNLTSDAFSQMDPTYVQLFSDSKRLDKNCGVYDPNLKYRWSARSCPDKLRFICQHKMPKVSEANRYKIYNRWNVTYPNALANEVVLEVVGERGRDGRYQRLVVAEGSAEQMTIPGRRRAGPRRTPPRHPVKHPNDVNYPQRSRNHSHKRPGVSSTTPQTPQIESNGVPSTAGTQPRTSTTHPHLTQYDRKLQRQRERELRRKLRRQERMEKHRKMQEKRLLSKTAEVEQLQQHQQQSEPDALRQRAMDEQQRQEGEQRNQQLQMEKQRAKQEREQQRELEKQQRQREERELEKRQPQQEQWKQVVDDESRQMREERLRKQLEREAEERKVLEEQLRKQKVEQDEIDRRNAEQRLANEQRLREENEKRLLEAKSEQERKLQEAHEAKRREEKAVEEALAEKERQRQKQIHLAQKEEEERQELERIEKERNFEKHEIQRLREEEARREKLKQQRQAEIDQREAEVRRLAEDEERVRKELLDAEKARKRQQEYEIELDERERQQREEAEKAAEAAKTPQSEGLQTALNSANEKVAQQLDEKRRKYAERIAALSPEDQEKFMEMRKKRKQMRQKQLIAREQTKLKRIQEAIRLHTLQ